MHESVMSDMVCVIQYSLRGCSSLGYSACALRLAAKILLPVCLAESQHEISI